MHRTPPADKEIPGPVSRRGGSSLRAAIRSGRWLSGTVISSPDLVLAERIAGEFDFVWIDLEHSALSVRDAQMLAIATKAGGAAALTRLPQPDSEMLSAILDTGIDGVVAPRIESADDARRLVDRLRYPPLGVRGFAPRRASGGRADLTVGSADTESSPLCVIQIESRAGIAQAGDIAAIDGVDALVVGTADLSFDLGVALDISSDVLAQAVAAVGSAATSMGKAWGVAMGDFPRWSGDLRRQGASLLVFSSDVRLYGDSIERASRCVQTFLGTAADHVQ